MLIQLIKKISRKGFDKYFDKLMPAYGHGQALHNPDIPYLKWSYEYDNSSSFSGLSYSKSQVQNKERFQRAFENMKLYLERYLQTNPNFKDDIAITDDTILEFFKILGQKATNCKILLNPATIPAESCHL